MGTGLHVVARVRPALPTSLRIGSGDRESRRLTSLPLGFSLQDAGRRVLVPDTLLWAC